jgi:hypothetical protein
MVEVAVRDSPMAPTGVLRPAPSFRTEPQPASRWVGLAPVSPVETDGSPTAQLAQVGWLRRPKCSQLAPPDRESRRPTRANWTGQVAQTRRAHPVRFSPPTDESGRRRATEHPAAASSKAALTITRHPPEGCQLDGDQWVVQGLTSLDHRWSPRRMWASSSCASRRRRPEPPPGPPGCSSVTERGEPSRPVRPSTAVPTRQERGTTRALARPAVEARPRRTAPRETAARRPLSSSRCLRWVGGPGKPSPEPRSNRSRTIRARS